jgi:sarcosine oxidase, subunit gamma
MADLKLDSALAGMALPDGPSFSLSENGTPSRLVFRSGEIAREQAGEALGLALPREACTSAQRAGVAALWVGPDEWLLLLPEPDGGALRQALANALVDVAHSIVDVSHRETELVIRGDGRARVLNAGCPLDLAEDTFPPGMCTRTLFGKAQVVLWRDEPRRFRLFVARSFARFVCDLLIEAAGGWEAGGEDRQLFAARA